MFNRWEQGVELRSDLSSLFDKPKSLRRAYANTLLKALQLTANRVRQYPAASFSTDHLRNEKMRIKSILHGDESTFKGFSSKLAIVSGAAFITLGMATIVSTTTYAKEASTSNLIGKNMELIMSGRLTASFGLAPDPFKANAQRDHKGIDVAAPLGTPIYAPEDGVVIEATDVYDNKPKYGKVVLIETSNNTKTLFAHLNSYSVEPGQRFKAGTLLATVGETGVATGPHVHMETYVNDKRVNPLQVWQLAE
jgi:murein DD-endopeptidase MepM/ murein hydrolase activator NlpD